MKRIHVVGIWAKFPEAAIPSELESLRRTETFYPRPIAKYIPHIKTNRLHLRMTLIKGNIEGFYLKVVRHTLSESVICLCNKVLIRESINCFACNLLIPVSQRVIQCDSVTPIKKQFS